MAQGVPGVRVEVARLLPGQLHQIVDQNDNRFARPSVYADDFDRLVERMTYTREFGAIDPAKKLVLRGAVVFGGGEIKSY